MDKKADSIPSNKPGRRWRLAARLGFWFFFLKGMLWLILPTLAVWFGWKITHP